MNTPNATEPSTLGLPTQRSFPETVAAPQIRNPQRGLPSVLMGLTLLSGIIDAVSYLGMGHLFLGKMTGNLVVLGMSTGQVPGFSIGAAALALTTFLLGAAMAGRLHTAIAHHRYRWIITALTIEAVLLVAAAGLAWWGWVPLSPSTTIGLITLIAAAMGFRNATVRKLGILDMTTTLVTLTLADLASDSFLAGRRNPRLRRRLGVVASIFGGALIGGYLVVAYGLVVPLTLSAALACALAVGYPAVHEWRARRGRPRS